VIAATENKLPDTTPRATSVTASTTAENILIAVTNSLVPIADCCALTAAMAMP
jgi:hypothetical protein